MKIKFAITALCAALLTGCGVAIQYSLSGASIPPDARTFTAYEDYESTRLLTEVEGELIPQIVDKLVTDIFQASASNW